MMLVGVFACIASFVTMPADRNIDSLFYHWNKETIHSLQNNLDIAANGIERELYRNRLDIVSDMWEIEADSLNKESIRWKFLNEIETHFNWNGASWMVIEVRKTGERMRLINFLVYNVGSRSKIVTYEYLSGKWKKMNERFEMVKIHNIKAAKRSFGSENYPYDVVVTSLKSDSVVESFYFVSSTLFNKSEIAHIIDKKGAL